MGLVNEVRERDGTDARSSILPPRQLPVLAAYACIINWLAGHGWIPAGAVGKAGGSIVGVLSMGMSLAGLGTPLCRVTIEAAKQADTQ